LFGRAPKYFRGSNSLKLIIMESKMSQNFEMEFIDSIKERDAWKKISANEEIPWSEKLISKYADQLEWNELSENTSINWTVEMLEKYKNRINWDGLSESRFDSYYGPTNYNVWSLIKPFVLHWNWTKLSKCRCNIPTDIVAEFADYWNWKELINNDRIKWSEELFLKFKHYIPVSNIEDFIKSELWDKIVSNKANILLGKVLSE